MQYFFPEKGKSVERILPEDVDLERVLLLTQDDYLSEGYFRSGSTMRQTRFIFIDGEVWSTVWARSPLQNLSFSKSQRRIMRRIQARFRVEIGPYRVKADQEAVYEAYCLNHPLNVASSVEEILGFYPSAVQFKTYSIRFIDKQTGELAGFSCFDRGEGSLASLFAAYLPEYRSYSLGFGSMLFEMAYGAKLKLGHYYPGYCVPGLAPFAYKLRLPQLEGRYYHHKDWRPMDEVLQEALPLQLINTRLDVLQVKLDKARLHSDRLVMPLFETLSAMRLSPGGPLPHIIMLELESHSENTRLFVGYDCFSANYELWMAANAADLREEVSFSAFVLDLPYNADLRVFQWRMPVHHSQDPDVMISFLKSYQAGSQ